MPQNAPRKDHPISLQGARGGEPLPAPRNFNKYATMGREVGEAGFTGDEEGVADTAADAASGELDMQDGFQLQLSGSTRMKPGVSGL